MGARFVVAALFYRKGTFGRINPLELTQDFFGTPSRSMVIAKQLPPPNKLV